MTAAGSFSVVVLQYLSGSGVHGEATPECIASAVVWNIPLGFSNDLLMALMSLHRRALLCWKREGGGGAER